MPALLDLATVDEYSLIRDICKRSLWEFVKEFWGEQSEEKLIENWHMPFLCSQLEIVAERVFRRQKKLYDLLINIAPGTTKSTIVSIMFPAWCWTRDPTLQFICASYNDSLAEYLADKSRKVVQSEKYQKAFPEVRVRGDQKAKSFFELTRGGWRMSRGIGGQTGKHAHIIIIDDPIDTQKALSAADIKSTNEWITGTINKRKVSHDNTPSIMIMQRVAENDPSAVWLEQKKKGAKIEHINLPAELTDNVKPARLKKLYKDGLFDSKRFSREVLEAQKREGPWTYQSQFLQDPVPPGGGLFKVDRISIEVVDYTVPGWQLVRYWDKASTGDAGKFTVGLLMGKAPDGVFWVLDVVRGQWEPAERERIMKQTAQRDGHKVVILIEQEPSGSGKESVYNSIKNLAGYFARADRPTGDKFVRADPFAGQVNAGNVKLRRAEWNEDYLNELRLFSPIAVYKDQVDASSGAFAYLAGRKIRIGGF